MLIVKKFGGTSVADKERIFNVAKRCIRDYRLLILGSVLGGEDFAGLFPSMGHRNAGHSIQ